MNFKYFKFSPTSEQFRVTFVRLLTILIHSTFPLKAYRFKLAIELRDEEEVDASIGMEDRWIAGLQRERRRVGGQGGYGGMEGSTGDTEADELGMRENLKAGPSTPSLYLHSTAENIEQK